MTPASEQPVPAPSVNTEYFSHARTIAQEAIDRARSQLAGPLGTGGWEGRHFLQLIADKKLILHARAIDLSFGEHLLTDHGFAYDKRLHAFDLPPDVDRSEAARRVAAITATARHAGRHVFADPAVFVTDDAPDAGTRPLCYPSLDELTKELHTIDRAGDIAEVLDLGVSGHGAVLAEFQHLLEDAAAWCERLGTDLGLRNAEHLERAADHLATVGRTVPDTTDGLANSANITFTLALPLERWPRRPAHPTPWPDPNRPAPAAPTRPPAPSVSPTPLSGPPPAPHRRR